MARIGILFAVVGLAACNANDDSRVAFDGFYFKAKSKRISDDRARFVVTVPKVSNSLDGARAAAEYEGTVYCLSNFFGTSRVKWDVGPETPVEQLVISDDTLTYQGECNP